MSELCGSELQRELTQMGATPPKPRLDFRNEALIAPTEAMWAAMRDAAEVMGMSSSGEDPTVAELEAVGARLTGHEAGYFVPSTTAGAAAFFLAVGVRERRVVMERRCHLWWIQRFHVAVYGGGIPVAVEGDKFGGLPIPALQRALDESAFGRRVETAAVCLENTHNVYGGTVLSADYTAQIAQVAHASGAVLFIDGARIFDAAVAQDVRVGDLTGSADGVVVSLNKALAAPYGALLCGTGELVARARDEAERFGANQVHKCGIFAAAALVGLNGWEERVRRSHRLARRLAEGLSHIDGLIVDLETVQTNLVRVGTERADVSAESLTECLASYGLGAQVAEPFAIRLVTHGGLDEGDIDEAVEIVKRVVADLPARLGA